ncbi:MAG: hypothetical protein IJI83_05105 [Oscillospiraceae bacterium]|nr:hypothetical protein [Oscillospiraceae bacterium]
MTRTEIRRRRAEYLKDHPNASYLEQDDAAQWPVFNCGAVVRNYIRRFPDITLDELTELAVWVADCNDPFDNPYDLAGDDCWPMDFITAYREMPF